VFFHERFARLIIDIRYSGNFSGRRRVPALGMKVSCKFGAHYSNLQFLVHKVSAPYF